MLLNECTFIEIEPNAFIQEDIPDVIGCELLFEFDEEPAYVCVPIELVSEDISTLPRFYSHEGIVANEIEQHEEMYKTLKEILDEDTCYKPSYTRLKTSAEGTEILIESWISSVIKNKRKLYNPKKQTFTLLDEETLKSTSVKKCNADEEDLEKAYMYALLKSFGVTPTMIQKEVDGIKYQYKGKVLSKKEYEALLKKEAKKKEDAKNGQV